MENEVIIEVNSNFTGEITPEMEELGVISLEKIFDIGDTIMYLVRIENAPDDVIEKLQELPQVKAAEYNQVVSAYQDNNTTAVATSKKGILLPMIIAICIGAVVAIKIILSKQRGKQ